MKRYNLLLLVITIHFIGMSTAIKVTSASYDIKDTNLEGVQWRHAIFTVKTDEELYYYNDPVCGCQRNMSSCNTKWATTTPINESGYNVTVLDKDLWYDVDWINHKETRYFKFYLQPSDSVTCPIVKINHNLNIGDANMAVSNSFIPTHTDQQWIKYRWFRDDLWICPNNVEWGYGWWYLTIFGDTPRVEYLSYRLRWSTKDVDVCRPPPPRIASPSSTDDWILLEDNIPFEGYFPSLKFFFFRAYVNASCTDFAISARPLTSYRKELPADFDLFVSMSDSHPETMDGGRNDYISPIEHDDYLTFRNICNNNNASSTVFYVGVRNWQGAGIMGSVVFNTLGSTWAKSPIVQNGPLQISYSLANEYAQLVCGPNSYEKFRSSYPSYAGAMPSGDQYGAQHPWYPIPLTEDTLNVNHIWPVPKAIANQYFLHNLEWKQHPNYTVNTKNVLRSALLLFTRTADDAVFNVISDVSTCHIKWNGALVNAQGDPLTGTTTFTKANDQCDPIAFRNIASDALNLISDMVTLTDYNKLRTVRARLEFLSYSKTWTSCRDDMYNNSFIVEEDTITVDVSASRCMNYSDTDEWRADPCCNIRAQSDSCCAVGQAVISYRVPKSLKVESVDSQCSTSQCAKHVFTSLISSKNLEQDPVLGCSATFNHNAGPLFLAESTDFYKYCRQRILGDNLQGIPCKQDSDCNISTLPYLSATCNKRSFVCSFNDSDVITCWTKTIDPLTARALYDLWQIPDKVTEARLTTEFYNRFVKDTCVGPTGLRYRENYNFASEYPTCFDKCFNPAENIDLQPYCLEEDERYCPVPFVCSTWLPPDNWCWRQFFHRQAQDSLACTDVRRCNWLDCYSSNNATCAARCNAASGQSVCIECTSLGCFGRPDLNQSQCVNTTSGGSCSVGCPGNTICSTKSSCEASGVCTGKESSYGTSIFQQYNRTALCFSPFINDYWGNSYCGGRAAFDWTDGSHVEPESHYGCTCNDAEWSHPDCNLAITATECVNKGFLWVKDDVNYNECNASTKRCFSSEKAPNLNPTGAFNLKSETDCISCAQEEYRTVNRWEKGTWTPQVVVSRFWERKQFASVNKWSPSIDYIGFGDEVSRALVARVALAYYTEALCRYDAELKAINAYTCDCKGMEDGSCYDVPNNNLFAVERVCPHVYQEYTHPQVIVSVPENAYQPELFCQNLYLSVYPAVSFSTQIKNKLSSEIFLERSLNPYAVVHTRDDPTIIGQIITDGINITWSSGQKLLKKITMCIPINIDGDRSKIGFGELVDGDQGITLVGYDVYMNESSVCFDVDKSGIYFGVALTKTTSNDVGWFISSAVLYAIGVVCVIIQCVRYISSGDYKKPSIFLLKPLLLGITGLFCSLRLTYMIYYIIAESKDSEAMLVLFELPSILSFSMEMGIYYIWRTIVQGIRKLKNLEKNAPLPKPFIISGISIVIIFSIFVVAFYTIEEEPILPCFSASSFASRTRHIIINIVYQAILALYTTVRAIAYLYQATVFLKLTKGHPAVVRATIGVLATFVPMFTIRSILIIWSVVTNGIVPVLVLTALEIIPVMVNLYYIHPIKGCYDDSPSGRSSTNTKLSTRTVTTRSSTIASSRDNSSELMSIAH